MLTRLARTLLVVALLLAQQSALAHDIWHLASGSAKSSSATPAIDRNDEDSKPDRLCDFHAALGTVVGIADGTTGARDVTQFHEVVLPTVSSPALRLAGLPPASRGPPILR